MTSPGSDPAARVITIARGLRMDIGRPDRSDRLPIDELRPLLGDAKQRLTTIRDGVYQASRLAATKHEPRKLGIAQSGMSRIAPTDRTDADREALLVGGLLQGSQRVNPAVVATLLHLVDHRLLIDPATAATWYAAKVAVTKRMALNPATLGRVEHGIGRDDLTALRTKYRDVDPATLEVDLLAAGREAAEVGLHRYSFIMTGQLEREARSAAQGSQDPRWLDTCLDLVHTVDHVAKTAGIRLDYADRIRTQITDATRRPALDAVMKAIHEQRLREAAEAAAATETSGESSAVDAGGGRATGTAAERPAPARPPGKKP